MRKPSTKQSVALIAAGAITLSFSGVAYAYWTTTGSGSGSGAAAAPQATSALTFTGQTQLVPMFPGDTAQDLSVTVTNTGLQNAYVGSVKAYLTVAKARVTDTSAGASPGATVDKYAGTCSAADFLLGNATATLSSTSDVATGSAADARSLTWTAQDLAKTSGAASATGKVQFNNTGGNQDGCKEAAVTINYVAS